VAPLEPLSLALGGALGGLARALISGWVTERAGEDFPWGTLAVNLSGAFLAGWVQGAASSGWLSPASASFLLGGLLGGYTTVSSLALQSLGLAERGRRRAAAAFLLFQLAAALPLAALGWLLASHG
jgi:CrcB protein